MQHTMDSVASPGYHHAHGNPQPIPTPVGEGVDSVETAKTVDAAGEYTCPMHPQVRQTGPGNCPICGMTLEPVVATAVYGVVSIHQNVAFSGSGCSGYGPVFRERYRECIASAVHQTAGITGTPEA